MGEIAKGACFGLKNGRRRPHKKLSFHRGVVAQFP
jgi:hypothetical protein